MFGMRVLARRLVAHFRTLGIDSSSRGQLGVSGYRVGQSDALT